MCLQLRLPRAGPITSARSQAEEISRVNLSCGPKWIQGNIGWSHYKEINGASTSWTLVPIPGPHPALNGEEQNHHHVRALLCHFTRFSCAYSYKTKGQKWKSVVKWFPSRCDWRKDQGTFKGIRARLWNSQSLTHELHPALGATSVLCFQTLKVILYPQRAGWQLAQSTLRGKVPWKNETLSGFLFLYNFLIKCPSNPTATPK